MAYDPNEWRNPDGSWKDYSDEEQQQILETLADKDVMLWRIFSAVVAAESGGGSYTAGDGIEITNNRIKVVAKADSGIDVSADGVAFVAGDGLTLGAAVSVNAGDGLSLTGTSPNKTVTVNAGNGLTLSGTSPNKAVAASVQGGVTLVGTAPNQKLDVAYSADADNIAKAGTDGKVFAKPAA